MPSRRLRFRAIKSTAVPWFGGFPDHISSGHDSSGGFRSIFQRKYILKSQVTQKYCLLMSIFFTHVPFYLFLAETDHNSAAYRITFASILLCGRGADTSKSTAGRSHGACWRSCALRVLMATSTQSQRCTITIWPRLLASAKRRRPIRRAEVRGGFDLSAR
jgi:hypothetical protein